MSRSPLLPPSDDSIKYGSLEAHSIHADTSTSGDLMPAASSSSHQPAPRSSARGVGRPLSPVATRSSDTAVAGSTASLPYLDDRDTQSETAAVRQRSRLHHRRRRSRSRRRYDHDLETIEDMADGLQGLPEDQVGSNFGLPVTFGLEEIEERRRLRSVEAHRLRASVDSPRSQSKHRLPSVSDDPHDEDSDREILSETDTSEDPDDPPDNSPYPQVRASVSAVDNVSLSINTPRMWALSILFSVLGSATNLFFSLRYPSVSLTPVIALLLVHPLGLLWDTILKRADDIVEVFVEGDLARRGSSFAGNMSSSQSVTPAPRRGTGERLRLWLAQGRWNEKEHACVYISSNVSFGFAFATDVIVEQRMFYKQETTFMYQILLTLSTQILGYSIAGVTRRYLVRPSGMIWPGTLISTAMFSTLHKEENRPANGWRISRWRFFLVTFLGSIAWYFLPGLLFPALSFFNVITWFAPRNVVVANLFGTVSGLGLFPVTFDWSQIAYIGSPLVAPFWAALNIVVGLIMVMWIAAPAMYYTNVLYSSYMPILSATVFDNTGKPYDVSRIITPDFLFDEAAYKQYSQVFLPITYVLSYGTQFAALTSLLTHTICWHGRDIVNQGRQSFTSSHQAAQKKYDLLQDDDSSSPVSDRAPPHGFKASQISPDDMMNFEDVHSRLMKRYRDVPTWWYLLTGGSMLAIGIFVVEYYPIHLPWYGLLLAFTICVILFIPIGIVMAITAQQSSIYLICQLVCGAVFPGRPVANMVFVTYGYITSTQGMKFSSDLKLGHYMKIPPKLLFLVQLVATVIASFTQIGVLNWMLANVEGICTPQAVNGFTCPMARVHFNGSILWGVLGPWRFFGRDAMYRPLIWFFLVGATLPLVTYAIYKRDPSRRFWRRVNFPVLFGSLSWIPPATGLNFSVWALTCWVFNGLIRKRRNEWWRKYNMTLSAALDAGVAFGVVAVFFGFVYNGLSRDWSWWGMDVYKQGCDWQACPYRRVAEGDTFGPGTW